MKELYSDGRINPYLPIERKTELQVQKFMARHGEKYDYSEFVYTDSKTLQSVKCKIHGIFKVSPGNHMKGQGCPSCQVHGVKPDTQELFIAKQRQVHGDTYDYQGSIYSRSKTKITIICRKHGPFSITPANHINLGHGCPQCQQGAKSIFLYLLKCNNTGLTKIGVTNNLKQRILNIGGNLSILGVYNLGNQQIIRERELHKRYSVENKYNPRVNNGNTEFFDLSATQIQDISQQLLMEVICR